MPDTDAYAAEFGYAGSGDNRSAFPKARVVAPAECGTHAFLAAELDPAELDPTEAHLVRVVEYDVPDRVGNGTGELIAVLSNICDPARARADEELAACYHERWQEETGNDQIKTHLRGPGKFLRSRLPELVYQEIWAWLLVDYALSTLAARAARAADLDPDRISFTRALRITRRTATGTAGFPLTTGHATPCPRSWPRSPRTSSRATAPTRGWSHEPGTTATGAVQAPRRHRHPPRLTSNGQHPQTPSSSRLINLDYVAWLQESA